MSATEQATLSRRRVRALLAYGQLWADQRGEVWKVDAIHRKDHSVTLVGRGRREVKFGDLGHSYTPVIRGEK